MPCLTPTTALDGIDRAWLEDALKSTKWVDQAETVLQSLLAAGIETTENIRDASSDTLKEIGISGLMKDVIKKKANGMPSSSSSLLLLLLQLLLLSSSSLLRFAIRHCSAFGIMLGVRVQSFVWVGF
jgi:hypothetical protein